MRTLPLDSGPTDSAGNFPSLRCPEIPRISGCTPGILPITRSHNGIVHAQRDHFAGVHWRSMKIQATGTSSTDRCIRIIFWKSPVNWHGSVFDLHQNSTANSCVRLHTLQGGRCTNGRIGPTYDRFSIRPTSI